MTLPDFIPPSVAKAANPAKDGQKLTKVSNFSNFSSPQQAENDLTLAAKLRALGQPIGLEVDGEVVAWIAADDEAAARSGLSPCFTADEAEVLSRFDEQGMRDLIEIKAKLGGKLSGDD